MRRARDQAGLSRFEGLLAVIVLGGLVWIALPTVSMSLAGREARTAQALANMRELTRATEALARDGAADRDPSRGWPGDTGGTFTNWTRGLVPAYLSTNDFRRLMSVAGRMQQWNSYPATNSAGIVVYAARADSPERTVFLSTANFLNSPAGGTLNPAAPLFDGRNFVILRRNGDGAILKASDAGRASAVGLFVPLCE